MMIRSRLVSVFLLISLGAALEGQAASQVSIEAFFSNPTVSSPRLSPDGRHIAFVFSKDDRQRVFVRERVGDEVVGLAEFALDKVRLGWLAWANSERVLLAGLAPDPSSKGIAPLTTRIFAVARERSRLRWLGERWPARGQEWVALQVRHPDQVISLLPSERDTVLVSHLEPGNETPSVSRLNVYSGRLRKRQDALPGVQHLYVDRRGEVRAGEAFDPSREGRGFTLLARVNADDELAAVFESEDALGSSHRFAGFHEDRGRIYVLSDHEGRDALFEFDIAQRKLGKLVFAHPEYDVTGIHESLGRNKVVGAEYAGDTPGIGFFDEDARREQALIDRSLRAGQSGGTTNRVVSATRGGKLAILSVSSDVQPPVYYAYNREKKEMNFVFEERAGIPVEALAPMEAIGFEARDGTPLTGYLTLPRDAETAKLPVIALAHRGFGDRVMRVFDPVVQLFANRGFAVLQVNTRGSRGLGRAFGEAGLHNWGERMEQDLNDGVRWLVEAGTADAERIGVFGTGFGGTVAMGALAAAPELYRAGASYAGIMDLEAQLAANPDPIGAYVAHANRREPRHDETSPDAQNGESTQSGDGVAVEDEGVSLRTRSPLHRTGDIRAAVLLAHGAKNALVLVEQTRAMVQALEASGKRVESIEYADEFDGLALESNRIDFYSKLLAFFEAELAAPVASPDPAEREGEAPSPLETEAQPPAPPGEVDVN
ncbi:MAG: S9 family peptidase [bacterium]|nr:S9 family peptidase [bacterium]